MATSGSITYTLTAQEVITQALTRIAVLGEGETASNGQYLTALTELNLLLKSFQIAGSGLMRRAEQTVSIVDGTQTYTLSPRPASVINVRFAVDGVERRPMSEWDREDWDAAPIKSNTGAPIVYIVDRQRTSTTLTVWPIPDVPSGETWTLKVSYERIPESVTAPTEEVDVAQEQLDALIDALAVTQISIYGVANTPEAQLVLQRAGPKLEYALGHDRRGSIRFTAS